MVLQNSVLMYSVPFYSKKSYLLIVRLHTQEDGVRCEAGQTAFNIWLATQFLGLSVHVVQRPHRFLKLLFVDLKYEERQEG